MQTQQPACRLQQPLRDFYDNLFTPVFYCEENHMGWHNAAAETLTQDAAFVHRLAILKPQSAEQIKKLSWDGFWYTLLLRRFGDGFFIEIIKKEKEPQPEDALYTAPAAVDRTTRLVSHEILRALEKLQENLDEKMIFDNRACLESISNGVHKMLRTAQLYLAYTKLLENDIALQESDLFAELALLCASVQQLMRQTDIPFSWKMPKIQLTCYVDFECLSYSLLHILCNSFAYTAPGNQVKLLGEVLGDTLRFTVYDKGMGIAPELIRKVQQPFFSYNPVTGGPGGCGLGLSYASLFAKKSGGGCAVTSGSNQTAVSLSLPLVKIGKSGYVKSVSGNPWAGQVSPAWLVLSPVLPPEDFSGLYQDKQRKKLKRTIKP